MASWAEFQRLAPEFAEFGQARFKSGVAYLGTLRRDGSPRVHPVTPIVGEELFLFMEPTSPKGKDLIRDGRYTLHCQVANMSGGEGEFYVQGRARWIDNPHLRAQAVSAAPYTPQNSYILFGLSIELAFMNHYVDGKANPRRWQPPDPAPANE